MCHPDTSMTGATQPARPSSEESFTIEVAGASMPVFQASPARPSRGNVIVIHDIHGANAFYHDLARRLASEGYTAYLPDLFVREGPLPEPTREYASARGQKLSYPTTIDDLKTLFGVVAQRSPGKVATVGFCMGGTLVMLLASREPRMAAGVIYYGFPANANISEKRPWQPLDEAATVETPLLGFWGDQDKGVGMDNVAAYTAGLDAAGKPHDFTIYPGLPHGFLTFDSASPNYAGSQDSWQKALAYFGDRLG
ncbi:MAG TPA: dienelactone hydrolase family protein [Thermomicrobiales bacterium]|nr:dienelactone hydrolase family protein [Thermomicrobiales bacterium]